MAIIGHSGTDMRNERHYVVGAITAFLNRTGSGQDWGDFTSSPLRDAELDRIRQCAGAIDLPLDAEGEAALRALLQQADLVSVYDGPVPWRLSAGGFAGLLLGAILWWFHHLPGAGLFHDLHLLVVPAALGAFLVALRNSRMKVGAHDPRIVAQNRRGRV
ncbi:hypothetical protein SLG_02450 [Sphingobium sp. SYK-6]|nr:hypothetical protein SLG_02450 [Sphingobium sp. SYK-6]